MAPERLRGPRGGSRRPAPGQVLDHVDHRLGHSDGFIDRGHGGWQCPGDARFRGGLQPADEKQLLPPEPGHLRFPSAFCIPLYVPYVLTGRWTFGRSFCKLWLVVDYLLCTTSVFNIVLISYDRFLSVTRAVSYRAQQGDTKQAVFKIVTVWVLAFLLYGPAIISWEYISGGSIIPEGECYAEFFYNWYFLITASTIEFFTPFISVTFFNLSIYLNIRKRTKVRLDVLHETQSQNFIEETEMNPEAKLSLKCCKWEQRNPAETLDVPKWDAQEEHTKENTNIKDSQASTIESLGPPGNKLKPSIRKCSKHSMSTLSLEKRMVSQNMSQRFRLSRDKKVAKSLAVIVGIFGLCWAPYTLLMIIRAACHGHCIPEYWYETSFWLLWVNSAINPVLYPLCHYSFRRAFVKLLCPKKLKIQPHSSLQKCWK
ncbi:histamine H3 receptor isoform X2 [Hemicordylus capensis]|uniref:histamine H3 receptor isoform X2 n=1 Tax=Hemicordylus capensis TaxID=884348 RepID=UPI0023033383|nr:histamine H3 receptor isoform X2 [Hemicordylus capensis]